MNMLIFSEVLNMLREHTTQELFFICRLFVLQEATMAFLKFLTTSTWARIVWPNTFKPF